MGKCIPGMIQRVQILLKQEKVVPSTHSQKREVPLGFIPNS
ncbi:hypothetical protein GGP50_002664 [Salinibacter ruber]|nr:hypothetical protein [Salinibacter ruber]